MRGPRVRLRTLMVAVAFAALLLIVVVPNVRLPQALARAQRFHALADTERARAKAQARPSRASLNRLSQQSAESRLDPSAVTPPP